jgi:hypothetical protein
VNDRSDLSRGDCNRNDKLARLRELLPATNAIVGIDLADHKRAAVVTDHDSRVLARRRLSCRVWELGEHQQPFHTPLFLSARWTKASHVVAWSCLIAYSVMASPV